MHLDQRIPPIRGRRLLRDIHHRERPGVLKTFNRLERDIVTFSSLGATIDETADILGASPRTVKFKHSTLPGKAGMRNFNQLIYGCLYYGLVEFVPRDASELGQITPRQGMVLDLAALGLNREETANFLGITESAVAGHRDSLYEQWDVNSARSATMRSFEIGRWATRSQVSDFARPLHI